MKFYLEWSKSSTFDAKIMMTSLIFAFDVEERESNFPRARITVSPDCYPNQGDSIKVIAITSKALEGNNSKLTQEVITNISDAHKKTIFQGVVQGFSNGSHNAMGYRSQNRSKANGNNHNECIHLTCLGINEAVKQDIETIRTQLVKKGNFDPLLVHCDTEGKVSLKDLLLFESSVLAVRRDLSKTALKSLVPSENMNDASDPHDLSGAFLYDGVHIVASSANRTRGLSWQNKSAMAVKASWIESYSGTTDISSVLAERLPGGIIETYTGKALLSRWWKPETNMGTNGYRLEKSELLPMGVGRKMTVSGQQNPSSSLPVASSSTTIKSHEKNKEKTETNLESVRFRPKISVNWNYRQPRQEVVLFGAETKIDHNDSHVLSESFSLPFFVPFSISVKNLRNCHVIRNWSPDLFFQRGDYIDREGKIYLCSDSHRSRFHFEDDLLYWQKKGDSESFETGFEGRSFFQSDRGKIVLEKAAQIYKSRMIFQQRSTVLKATCDAYKVLDVFCHDYVIFQDSRYAKTPQTCRVIGWKVRACGQTGSFLAELTMVPESFSDDMSSKPASSSLSDDPYENRVSLVRCNAYKDSMAGSDRGLEQDSEHNSNQDFEQHLFTAAEILKDVSLYDHAEDQEIYVRETINDAIDHSALTIPGTRLRLKLEDLNQKDPIITYYHGVISPCSSTN